jgi:23S rRNA (cytosine1962-C5)-methyltransferase
VDPPPFAPGKNQIEAARRGYKELALRTLKMLTPGGTLFFFSCSAAFSGEMLCATLDDAARDAGRELCILAELRQGADHPVLAQVPETGYLKGFVLEVTP